MTGNKKFIDSPLFLHLQPGILTTIKNRILVIAPDDRNSIPDKTVSHAAGSRQFIEKLSLQQTHK